MKSRAALAFQNLNLQIKVGTLERRSNMLFKALTLALKRANNAERELEAVTEMSVHPKACTDCNPRQTGPEQAVSMREWHQIQAMLQNDSRSSSEAEESARNGR